MKYVAMIYGNQAKWDSFPAEAWPEAIARQEAFNRKYRESGELIGAYGLADAAAAQLVRREGGALAVTDGPYLETKEYLGQLLPARLRQPGAGPGDRRGHALRGRRPRRTVAGPARVRGGRVSGPTEVEDLLRAYAPQVLGTLVRRYGTFDTCEDAVQEALIAAARQWPAQGIPDNPRGWLVTVAARKLVDQVRSEAARRRREDSLALATPASELLAHAADEEPGTDRDDSLALLFLCCHRDLSPPSRIALTLRAVGGLTTAQIAAAFLVPESTMAQRISRAKQTIKAAGGSARAAGGGGPHRPPRATCGTCSIWSSTRATRPAAATSSPRPSCPRRRSGSRGCSTGWCPRTPRRRACWP